MSYPVILQYQTLLASDNYQVLSPPLEHRTRTATQEPQLQGEPELDRQQALQKPRAQREFL
jgi:hypothetical protein